MSQLTAKIDALIQAIDNTDKTAKQQAKNTQQLGVNTVDDDDKKDQPVSSNDQPRILIADKLGQFVIDDLKKLNNIRSNPSLNGDSLRDSMISFQPNVIVVRSTKIQKVHLSASSSLALIVRAGAGVNTIDVNEASNRGIYVANCPGKNAIAVAEIAMGHLVNMDRRLSDNVGQLRNGKWNKKEFGKARGLYGRSIAVIGIGNIGRELCKRLLGFGMVVRGFSRSLTVDIANNMGITYCGTIQEAVSNADALSIHLPHNDETHYIINKDILSLLRDGAYIVNTSRGGVVNEQDMLTMIKEKNLRYAPDVYENEPKSTDKVYNNKDMYSNPNVFGSHHIGASTQQASDAVGSEVLRIINKYLSCGEVDNCVNLEKQSPAKYSLSIRHRDVVGVLATILDTLKNANINVQEMRNIIFKGAKSACCTLQLDQKPNKNTIKQITNHQNVYGVELSQK